jgi:uncharacterized protein (DUF433 family)
MLPAYKLNIFTNAVIARYENGEGTVEEIVATYTKLTAEEQQQVIDNVYAKRPDLKPQA